VLFQGLASIAGEEAVNEMLSYFPARDVEEPVTREFLRAELSELRVEMQALNTKLLVWLMATILTAAALAVTVTVNLVR
jgi:hypothetical protein